MCLKLIAFVQACELGLSVKMSSASGGGAPEARRPSSEDAEKQSGNLLPDELKAPGENLAEFVQQLEDYMPTVSGFT